MAVPTYKAVPPRPQFGKSNKQIPSGGHIGAQVSKHGSTGVPHSVPPLGNAPATHLVGPSPQAPIAKGSGTTQSIPKASSKNLATLSKLGY